jgi:hypothetical protein
VFTSASRSSPGSSSWSVLQSPLVPGSRSGLQLLPHPAQRSSTGRLPLSPNGAARQRAPAFSFLSEHAAEQRWRKTPRGVVGLVSNPHRPPLLLKPCRGVPRGKAPRCPWLAAVPGQVAPAVMLRPPRMLGGKGAAGSNPFPVVASGFACTRRTLACVPAGRLGRARHPARAGAVGPAAPPLPGSTHRRCGQRGKGKERGVERKLTIGTRLAEDEKRKGGAVRVSGPKGTLGLGRCIARWVEFGPSTWLPLTINTK